MALSLAALNGQSQADFTRALGATYEHSPAVAAAAWHQRPFATLDDLHRAMVAVVEGFSPARQLALICAHPDLGHRVAMAAASVQEQTGAGLDQLSPAQQAQFQQLNRAYRDRFGFPFVMAVAGQTPAAILQQFQQRLALSPAAERQRALREIHTIARLRLGSWISDGQADHAGG